MHSLADNGRLVVFTLLHAQHGESGIAWLDIRDYQSLSFTSLIKLPTWKTNE